MSDAAPAVVAIVVDEGEPALLSIAGDGQVEAASADAEPGVTVPLTGDQRDALLSGAESLAQAFMRGDVKPVGATGPLLALVELVEDPESRQLLAGHL